MILVDNEQICSPATRIMETGLPGRWARAGPHGGLGTDGGAANPEIWRQITPCKRL
jgi:hypothetical protein